jgi:hypothetical protein
MRALVILFAFSAQAQTLLTVDQVQWNTVNLSACGIPASGGTLLQVNQIRMPPQPAMLTGPKLSPGAHYMTANPGPAKAPIALQALTPNCWPAQMSGNAWNVFETYCTRCHGADLVPGDTHLVDFLDMRTRAAILAGGGRGPAMVPNRSAYSLIYLFTQIEQSISMPPTPDDVTRIDALDTFLAPRFAVGMPPAGPLAATEVEAIRAWIDAGAP